ncbi:MAG: non-ribosomal peptide synthetase, partial [Rhodococcus sp. (in: high G+C Gram-positive bacteria)]|uniref:non-ribosomal peptide synthetase n=1 Tax=Rhodococcus sp. TaxID=1831 RepID=UPI003BB148AB
MNSHAAIVNRLLWMQAAFALGEDDRVLQKTPFSFDVSVWEFFWPLMCGATLVVARPGGHRDAAYLAELIERERVTTLHFVPSMLEVFLEEPGVAAHCGTVRRVMSSGETLAAGLARRFWEELGETGCELHNLYGPTEAAVDVTWWECQRGWGGASEPIGRPIANTQIYVLDMRMEPVPIGVSGELYIGGAGVGRGYLKRAGLTAEKFVPDPFSSEAGGRLYRTGDVARYRADGEIEFLGRSDHQVKVRGFRVGLGEIEAALTAHAAVRQAVVVARGAAGAAVTQLVAYVVCEGEVETSELRRHLRARLPEYMVPGWVVTLAEMPLTPNGKIDRRRLPAPEQDHAEMAKTYVAPKTELEQHIAQVWQQLLGIEKLGVNDNFFDLGGHSLLIVKGRGKLQESLGRDISIVELFQYPTIGSLAKHLGENGSGPTLGERGQHRAETRKELTKRRRLADRARVVVKS